MLEMTKGSPDKHGKDRPRRESQAQDFDRQASQGSSGILSEFWHFLRYNKKWWLTPIIVVLLLVALLIVLGGSAAAPFIYTLF
jgi:hypothetical protein